MPIPIAFIICTEPGRLEKQSQILAESIREFGGQFKETPIYSFHPRKGEPVKQETLKQFELLGVKHQQVPLNVKYHDYYFLPEQYNIGLRVEYGRGVGSTGPADVQEEYWQQLYQALGVKRERFVLTPVGNKKIRAYWNSGMVAVRRSAGIFTAWKNNFEQVMELQIIPKQGNYMVEQSVLSVTVCAMDEEVFTFSPTYSYPLPLHNRLSKEFKIDSLDKMVSIHYFGLFYYRNWQRQLNKLRGFNKKSTSYLWLCQTISKYDLDYYPLTKKYLLFLKWVEKRLRQFNININISSLFEA